MIASRVVIVDILISVLYIFQLANSDHTHTVLRAVLTKYNLKANTDDYILVQSLPDGSGIDLLIFDNFYCF